MTALFYPVNGCFVGEGRIYGEVAGWQFHKSSGSKRAIVHDNIATLSLSDNLSDALIKLGGA